MGFKETPQSIRQQFVEITRPSFIHIGTRPGSQFPRQVCFNQSRFHKQNLARRSSDENGIFVGQFPPVTTPPIATQSTLPAEASAKRAASTPCSTAGRAKPANNPPSSPTSSKESAASKPSTNPTASTRPRGTGESGGECVEGPSADRHKINGECLSSKTVTIPALLRRPRRCLLPRGTCKLYLRPNPATLRT
jgi:hypothetical protein